jgi:thiamine-phosphate diphosphorylase
MTSAPLPPLHIVTDDAVVGRADFAGRAGEALAAGGAAVALHLRAPRATGRIVHDLAVRLMETARAWGSLLIVNGRVDVALAAGAHGAQLGARSLAPADARALLGLHRLVGASVHSVDEARAAVAGGADFLLAGPIHATASHPRLPPAGTGLIETVAALGIPVIAIGGITPERAGEARRAGAAGVAAIRGVWGAGRPADAVQRYLEAWHS